MAFLPCGESGFNISLSRGRGYARAGETPVVSVPPKGPSVTLMAMMGRRLGLIHEKYWSSSPNVNANGTESLLLPTFCGGSTWNRPALQKKAKGGGESIYLSPCTNKP